MQQPTVPKFKGGKKYFKADGEYYPVSSENEKAFLEKYPEAEEIFLFDTGEEKHKVSKTNLDAFKEAFPSAKRIGTGVEGNFFRGSAPKMDVARILKENMHQNFVKRMFDPYPASIPSGDGDGKMSTHSMATGEGDGKFWVYPTVVEKDGKLVRLSDEEASRHSIENKEGIAFDTAYEAEIFAKGAWKDVVEKQKPKNLKLAISQLENEIALNSVSPRLENDSLFQTENVPKHDPKKLELWEDLQQVTTGKVRNATMLAKDNPNLTADDIRNEHFEVVRNKKNQQMLAKDIYSTQWMWDKANDEKRKEFVEFNKDKINRKAAEFAGGDINLYYKKFDKANSPSMFMPDELKGEYSARQAVANALEGRKNFLAREDMPKELYDEGKKKWDQKVEKAKKDLIEVRSNTYDSIDLRIKEAEEELRSLGSVSGIGDLWDLATGDIQGLAEDKAKEAREIQDRIKRLQKSKELVRVINSGEGEEALEEVVSQYGEIPGETARDKANNLYHIYAQGFADNLWEVVPESMVGNTSDAEAIVSALKNPSDLMKGLDVVTGQNDVRGLIAVQKELEAIAPLLYLNRLPVSEKDSAWEVFYKTALQEVSPAFEMSSPDMSLEKDVAERTLQTLNLMGVKVDDPEGQAQLGELSKPYEHYSSEDLSSMLGTTTGLMAKILIPSPAIGKFKAATKVGKWFDEVLETGALTGKADDAFKLFGSEKVGSGVVKSIFQGAEEGARFELAGQIFNEEDELNFVAGALGGFMASPISQWVEGGAGKAIHKQMARIFGDQTEEAVKHVHNYGKVLGEISKTQGRASAEVVQEFGEELGNIYRESDSWEDVKTLLDERFGETSDLMHFAVSSYVMGLGFGAATSIGQSGLLSSKSYYMQLSDQEKAQYREFLDEIKGEMTTIEEQVAEQEKEQEQGEEVAVEGQEEVVGEEGMKIPTSTDPITNTSSPDYKYKFGEDGAIDVVDLDGNSVHPNTKRKYHKEYVQEVADKGKRAPEPESSMSEQDYGKSIAKESENLKEISEEYERSVARESVYPDEFVDPVEAAIAENMGVVLESDFEHYAGYGKKDLGKSSLVVKESKRATTGIDQIAKDASSQLGMEVTTDNVVDFLMNYPDGIKSLADNNVFEEKQLQEELKERFVEVGGIAPTKSNIEAALGHRIGEVKQAAEQDFEEYLKTAPFSLADTDYVEAVVEKLKQAIPDVNVSMDQKEFEDRAAQAGVKADEVNGFYSPSEGKIYINPDRVTRDTPIHEFGHVWVGALKDKRPDLYDRGLSLVEGTPYLDEAKKSGATNPAVEALVQAIGEKGASIESQAQRDNFLEWLNSLWEEVKALFEVDGDIENMTLDEFTQLAATDLLSGKRSELFKDDMLGDMESEDDLLFQKAGPLRGLIDKIRSAVGSGVSVDSIRQSLVDNTNLTEDQIDSILSDVGKKGKMRKKARVERAKLTYLDEKTQQALSEVSDKYGSISHEAVNEVAQQVFDSMVNSVDPDGMIQGFFESIPETVKSLLEDIQNNVDQAEIKHEALSTMLAMVANKVSFYYHQQGDMANYMKWEMWIDKTGRQFGRFNAALSEDATPEGLVNRQIRDTISGRDMAMGSAATDEISVVRDELIKARLEVEKALKENQKLQDLIAKYESKRKPATKKMSKAKANAAAKKLDDIANDLEKQFKEGTFALLIPPGLIVGAIRTAANLIRAGASIAEAFVSAMDQIRKSKEYRDLDPSERVEAEKNVRGYFRKAFGKDFRKEINNSLEDMGAKIDEIVSEHINGESSSRAKLVERLQDEVGLDQKEALEYVKVLEDEINQMMRERIENSVKNAIKRYEGKTSEKKRVNVGQELRDMVRKGRDEGKSRNDILNELEEFGLTPKDANDYYNIVTEAKVDENVLRPLINKYERKMNPDPEVDNKKAASVTDNLLKYILAGALDQNNARDAFADYFGLKSINTEQAQDLKALAEKVNKYRDAKNRVMQKQAIKELKKELQKLQEKDVQYYYDFVRGLFFMSALSGLVTQLRASVGLVLSAGPNLVAHTLLQNPAAVFYATKAAFSANGFVKGMKMALQNIPIEGETEYDNYGHFIDGKADAHGDPAREFVVHGLGEYYRKFKETQGLEKGVNAVKMALAAPAQMYRMSFFVMLADAVFMDFSTEYINSLDAFEKEMKRQGIHKMNPIAPLFRIKELSQMADKAQGLDSETQQQIKEQVDREIEEMKASGEKIPLNYKSIRRKELTDDVRGQKQVLRSIKMAKEFSLMGAPTGLYGRIAAGIEKGTNVKFDYDDKWKNWGMFALGMGVTTTFAFYRITMNILQPIVNTIPVVGLIPPSLARAGIYWEKSDVDGKYHQQKMSGEKYARWVALNMMATTLGMALFGHIFDLEEVDDDDRNDYEKLWMGKYRLKLNPNRLIDISANLTGNWSDNLSMAPGEEVFSVRFRSSPDGEWSDPLNYTLAPVAVSVMSPIGYWSDQIKYSVKETDVEDMSIGGGMLSIGHSLSAQTFNGVAQTIEGAVQAQHYPDRDPLRELGMGFVVRPINTILQPNIVRDVVDIGANRAEVSKTDPYGYTERMMAQSIYLRWAVDQDKVDMFGYPMLEKDRISDFNPTDGNYMMQHMSGKPEYELMKHFAPELGSIRAPQKPRYEDLDKYLSSKEAANVRLEDQERKMIQTKMKMLWGESLRKKVKQDMYSWPVEKVRKFYTDERLKARRAAIELYADFYQDVRKSGDYSGYLDANP